MKQLILTSGVFVSFVLMFGCTNQADKSNMETLKSEVVSLKKIIENLKPGLGEIMTTIHLHHAKLYFSGQSENWELASYQLDEIKEGLDEATELHEHFKEVKTSLKDLRHLTDQSLADIETAIKEKNKSHFLTGFQRLTVSCNQCHQAADHGFIVVQAPTGPMFTNQRFSREK